MVTVIMDVMRITSNHGYRHSSCVVTIVASFIHKSVAIVSMKHYMYSLQVDHEVHCNDLLYQYVNNVGIPT